MKKHDFRQLLAGVITGAVLFNAVPAVAAGVTAALSDQPVTLNGKPVQITAYNIEGSNYFKLRDLAAVLDVCVWYEEAARTIRIEPDKPFDPDYTGPGSPAGSGGINITDYYSADGKFSALGLALPTDSKNSEKTLTVKSGDIIIVGKKQYKVGAEPLVIPFYTQPSLDKVIVWWTDYMDSWLESGKVTSG
ncbi:MAG: hypothetical protein FWG32_05295 [Oscillospiraceae bacterium]|nr:hypothetical protein [Oscillospiraceae bacterium]